MLISQYKGNRGRSLIYERNFNSRYMEKFLLFIVFWVLYLVVFRLWVIYILKAAINSSFIMLFLSIIKKRIKKKYY